MTALETAGALVSKSNLPALRPSGAVASRAGSKAIQQRRGELSAATSERRLLAAARAELRAGRSRRAVEAANALQSQAGAALAVQRDARALRSALADDALRRAGTALRSGTSEPAALGAAALLAALEGDERPIEGRRLELLRAGAELIEQSAATKAGRGQE